MKEEDIFKGLPDFSQAFPNPFLNDLDINQSNTSLNLNPSSSPVNFQDEISQRSKLMGYLKYTPIQAKENDYIDFPSSEVFPTTKCTFSNVKEALVKDSTSDLDARPVILNQQLIKTAKLVDCSHKSEPLLRHRGINLQTNLLTEQRQSVKEEVKEIESESEHSHASNQADDDYEQPSENLTPSPKIPKKKGKRSQVFKRWGRENDKVLFKHIRELKEEGVDFIDHIKLLTDPENIPFDDLVQKVAEITQWRGPLTDMVIRVKNLSSSTTFSVRENKAFKRLVRPQLLTGYINYQYIQREFPGKSIELLQAHTLKLYGKKLEEVQRKCNNSQLAYTRMRTRRQGTSVNKD